MNNVKDIVSPFRARRTEDTQKGPGSTREGPGRFALAPHQPNSARIRIYVKDFGLLPPPALNSRRLGLGTTAAVPGRADADVADLDAGQHDDPSNVEPIELVAVWDP